MSSNPHPIATTHGWQKSSYSNGTGGECLEVSKHSDATILVRDSKHSGGPVLGFPWPAWQEFVRAVQRCDLHWSLQPVSND
ncbi:DUF397 domain-containing protein [Streptomyces sp. CB02923]|uniref:DUF397 domain-containing protein n=1 Tax=Streptomyces sp. CB02923 TaxID=1718985 RepID=UPI00093C89B1|nr:DUF397 domain-containing protein [Streptomyces sp. CB02923]